MAAVYKTIAKKQKQRELDEEDEAVLENMEMLSDESDTDSDEEMDDSEEEEQQQQGGSANALKTGFMPKTRVLMLTSRGVTHRWVALRCNEFD
ncbi:WD repeat-containing protein 43, partial [Ascosphaera pollenicola]